MRMRKEQEVVSRHHRPRYLSPKGKEGTVISYCFSGRPRKASKWYPADDEPQAKKVRKAVRPWTPRQTLVPGTVLILLAGRFRGKRVVLLKTLDQGVLLVTGPFKINGVPLRRVNSRYVIATSEKVDVSGVDEKKLEEVSAPKYFTAEKAKEKAGEEAFFKQGEAPKQLNGALTFV
ncbi:60S ribosomal protein L6-B like, partial [Verticillium longisporum]